MFQKLLYLSKKLAGVKFVPTHMKHRNPIDIKEHPTI